LTIRNSTFRALANDLARPRLRNQLALPLAATALFGSALYIFDLTLAGRTSPPGSISAYNAYDWARVLIEVSLWVSLAFVFVRATGELIFGFIYPKRKGYEAPSLLRDIFTIIVFALFVALLIKHFFTEISLTALFSTSAFVGVILGLALQDTLGNLFTGISLHADKPFQVGDVLTVGKWTGVVEGVTWRAAKIRTFQNHVVLVSNSSIAKESIEVCPRQNLNARVVYFSALYTDSPVKVSHVVREAVREAENVAREKPPIVRIRNLGDSGVEYEVKYWLKDYARYNDTDALVRQRIWYAFSRAGLNFAFPTQTLYIERPTARGLDGDGIAQRLSAVDIFAPLSTEELSRLARNSERHVYAPGEAIIRAGDEGSSMFIVHRGHVEVRVNDNGQPRTVARLGEGDFFGEMALFTGEPRTASVVSAAETEVLEIGHKAMKHLFETNPDLVESLSYTIMERRAGLASQTETETGTETEPEGFLAAVKRFFRLD